MANPPMAGGTPAMQLGGVSDRNQNPKSLLPTFIYDYFIKKREYALAEAILSSNLQVQTLTRGKTSPDQVNGIDDDSKDDLQRKLDALPRPSTHEQLPDSPFLDDWWSVFWDIWSASRSRAKGSPASQYFTMNQSARGARNQNQANMIQASMLNGQMGMNGMNFNMMRGGMNPNMQNGMPQDMRRTAINGRVAGAQAGRMNPQVQGRDGADGTADGQRAQSPMSGGDNAPSPKRQRLDGPGMAAQQAQGRPNMPGGPMANGNMMPAGFDNSMMMQNGKPGMFPMKPNPAMGTPGAVPQGSPIMSGPDGQVGMPNEMFNQAGGQMGRGMGATNQQGGALADYQMQLMLLEQQNKKRLLMARQEQEVGSHAGNGGASGQGGTASPMPGGDMPNRTSPAPGFDQMNPQMNAAMFSGMKMDQGGMNPAMMRPPGPGQLTPQQMEMLRQNNGRLPNGGGWPGNPMGGQMGPGGPQGQVGPPGQGDGQRNQMPPPSAPAGNAAGRTQTSSPSQQQTAPPTPSQGTKAAPKKKNTKDDSKKKAPKKAANAANAATPAQNAQPNQAAAGPVAGAGDGNAGAPDNAAPFGNIGDQGNQPTNEMGMPFDFAQGGDQNNDPLDGFDFDSFLHMDSDMAFDQFDPSNFSMGGDGVEMGTGPS